MGKNENSHEQIKRKKTIIVSIIILLMLIIISRLLHFIVVEIRIMEMNRMVRIETEKKLKNIEELNTLISDSEKLVNSKEKALDETLRTNLETAISQAQEVNEKRILILKGATYAPNTEKEYSNLKLKYDALNKSIKQYALVDKPSESYVITALKQVPSVVDILAVTEENEPNGNLNKQGSYIAKVYFSSKYVNQKDVIGDSIIEKGTDAGGSIEIYTTAEAAQKREQYLTGLEDTLLTSGSYKVIGTVLIRTSNKLTEIQKKELEANIVAALLGEELPFGI